LKSTSIDEAVEANRRGIKGIASDVERIMAGIMPVVMEKRYITAFDDDSSKCQSDKVSVRNAAEIETIMASEA
jgi:hypothetical protein